MNRLSKPRTNYVELFQNEIDKIDKLQETPNIIKQQALSALTHTLSNNELTHQAKNSINNSIKVLNNISNSSISDNYKVIYSQMCILAVSSLEAILKKYFINAVNNYEKLNKEHKRLAEIKVSVLDIVNSNLRFGGKLGQLIIDKDNPNFQDLKSIKNIFESYLNKKIDMEVNTEKKICFYLELRHVLVHKGGKIDDKFVNSTNRFKANIKNLRNGDTVELGEDDWEVIKESFKSLVNQITIPIESK